MLDRVCNISIIFSGMDELEVEYGKYKYFRESLLPDEIVDINALTRGNYFINNRELKWLSVYLYEDGEYCVCLDLLGESYYENSEHNERFKKNIRLEKSEHVIHFINQFILNDKYFLK